MKALYDEIRDKGFSALARLWETKVQESLQLEFKQKANSSYGRLDQADYDNLGKTLSAFANSAGGLLVWGVRTEKHGKGKPDAADRGVPISELALFQSELSRAVGEALMPRHEWIQITTIQEPTNSDVGYIAIWVDRSDRRPHRAERAVTKYYYKRAGSSTFAMEHYDIEDAFNRNAPTNLELVLGPVNATTLERQPLERPFRITMEFCLQNSSSVSACAPYVWVEEIQGGKLTPISNPQLKYSTIGARVLFAGDASTFVHPGLDISAFKISFKITHHLGLRSWFHNDDPLDRALLRFSVGVGCQNARTKLRTVEYAPQALSDLVNKAMPG